MLLKQTGVYFKNERRFERRFAPQVLLIISSQFTNLGAVVKRMCDIEEFYEYCEQMSSVSAPACFPPPRYSVRAPPPQVGLVSNFVSMVDEVCVGVTSRVPDLEDELDREREDRQIKFNLADMMTDTPVKIKVNKRQKLTRIEEKMGLMLDENPCWLWQVENDFEPPTKRLCLREKCGVCPSFVKSVSMKWARVWTLLDTLKNQFEEEIQRGKYTRGSRSLKSLKSNIETVKSGMMFVEDRDYDRLRGLLTDELTEKHVLDGFRGTTETKARGIVPRNTYWELSNAVLSTFKNRDI